MKNAGSAIAVQIIDVILKFICRTVFIYVLGAEFLGISSLYTNVLTILSITELGFSTAITYSLYEPLSQNNHALIRSLMIFYRKVHRIVGLIVLILGLVLMPFLPHLMTGVTDAVNIYLYYVLYLAQAVISYWFFSYKASLLVADQKKYVSDYISTFGQMIVVVLQVVTLLAFHSFLIYTILGVAMSVVQNLLVARQVDKRYPYLREQAEPLSKEHRRTLYDQVHALFLQRISTVIGTATDNIIISSFVSILAVGLYNNYFLIVSIAQRFLGNLFRGMTASVGNLYTTESKEHSAFIFRTLNLANSYLVCLASVCFLALFQPFITLWIGDSFLLDNLTVFIIVLNFATNFMQNIVLIYRDATGLFTVGRYRSVINAALNLGLSLILVQPMGMAGVFLGSILSRLATNWWFDAWVLHRKGFHLSPWRYYGACGACLAIMLISWKCIEWITIGFTDITWGLFTVRALLAVGITTGIYLVVYGWKKEVKYLVGRVFKR